METDSIASSVYNLLQRNGDAEATADAIGSRMSSLERDLLKLYSAPTEIPNEAQWIKNNNLANENKNTPYSSIEGAIKALEMKYQRATRVMQGFTQLMRTMHEILMAGIQNLRLR